MPLLISLYPLLKKFKVDHCYTTLTDQDKSPETSMNGCHITRPLISCPYSDEAKREKVETIIENLTLTETEIEELEKKTRYQSKDPLWFDARRNRITGKKCENISA